MSQNLTAEKKKTVSIKRSFNAPLKSLWAAWTQPENAKKWWGPQGYTCPDCTMDFKVGGKYLMSMQGPDGKKTWSTGIYKEIIPFKKIVLTDSFSDSKGNVVPASYYNMPGEWDPEVMITVEFSEADGKANISLKQTNIPLEIYDDCIKGWQSSCDKLESSLGATPKGS